MSNLTAKLTVTKKETYIALLSICFAIILLLGLINDFFIGDFGGKYFLIFFTNQSNIIVFVWVILYIIGILWKNNRLYRLTHYSPIISTITFWISITFFIVAFMLFPVTGGKYYLTDQFFIVHALSPIYMWVIFLIVPGIGKFTWKHLLYSLIYPAAYLIFTVIIGETLNFFPYDFVNYKKIGTGWYILCVVILTVCFAGFGYLLGKAKNKVDKILTNSHT